ncbi:MAG: hypothetical protein RI965_347 [Bacteroidota bacterium]|jgi:hypothetical protein
MFIGEKEIKSQEVSEKDPNYIILELEDGYKPTIHKDLFALLATEEKGDGLITDHVRDYFARKFVAELAQYGIEYYLVSQIGIGMETLCHNLREDLFRHTFECGGANEIRLDRIVEEK